MWKMITSLYKHPDKADSKRRSGWLEWVFIFSYAGVSLFIISAPLTILLDRFIPDDAFYYFNTARIFAQTGFSSFDRIHFTNGYQPLWFVISIPVFWIFPDGGELPLRVMMFVQVTFSVTGAWLFVRTLSNLFDRANAIIAGGLLVLFTAQICLNGLETSLLCLIYALLFWQYERVTRSDNQPPSLYHLACLGILAGLAFLARTDSIFLVGGVAVTVLVMFLRGFPRFKILVVAFALPLIFMVSGYLGLNFYQTGHFMPVSGAAKIYFSDISRSGWMAAQKAGLLQSYLHNLDWVFWPNYRFILIGLVGPWLLILLSWVPGFKSSLEQLRRFWPFFFGSVAVWMFYVVVFFGNFTTTLWYYLPQMFLAALSVAAFGNAIDRFQVLSSVPSLMAGLILALVLDWAKFPLVLLILIILSAISLLVRRYTSPLSKLLPFLLALMYVFSVGWVYFNRVYQVSRWVIIVPLLAGFLAFLIHRGETRKAAHFVAGLIVLAVLVIHLRYLVPELTRPPGNWNYNLYQGALWARQNTSAETTIWSGSAGILGYFSERRVVNIDGLANDYDFLELFLKENRVGEYIKQWDYGINTFVDGRLKKEYPDGCYITPQEQYWAPAFQDGSLTRQLRIFKMDCYSESGY